MLKPNLLGRIRDVPYHTNECVMDFFVGVVFNDITAYDREDSNLVLILVCSIFDFRSSCFSNNWFKIFL